MMIDSHPTPTLRGHVALVTDGGRGLGAAIALALADAGAAVAPLAHESCELTAVAGLVRLAGGGVLGITAPDYADAEAVGSAIDAARDYLGPITIYVDTVGIPAALDAVLPDMVDAQGGCFITVGDAPARQSPRMIAWLHIDRTATPEANAALVCDFCLKSLSAR